MNVSSKVDRKNAQHCHQTPSRKKVMVIQSKFCNLTEHKISMDIMKYGGTLKERQTRGIDLYNTLGV